MTTCAEYLPISLATLVPTDTVGLDLYQNDGTTDRMVLYCRSDFPLTLDDLHRLRKRGTQCLFIAKKSRECYQKYLRQVAANESRQTVPIAARVGALNEVVRDVLRTSFAKDDVDQTVAAADNLGTLAIDIIVNDEFAIADLFDVLHHDYATFTHSTNVAFYAATLAAKLGYSTAEIQQITSGGLLHDLGKLQISEAILCKPGRLDTTEFGVIKLHPLTAFRRLVHRQDLCEGQLMMAYQHHERLDGSGYPVGVTADQIHPWAKLCTVVDVFEALTSNRPYRNPMSHERALEIMNRDVDVAFDREVLECWNMIIRQGLNS